MQGAPVSALYSLYTEACACRAIGALTPVVFIPIPIMSNPTVGIDYYYERGATMYHQLQYWLVGIAACLEGLGVCAPGSTLCSFLLPCNPPLHRRLKLVKKNHVCNAACSSAACLPVHLTLCI